MEVVIYLALVLFGLCMGSFAGASVWRLRAAQLKADKKAGQKVPAAEYKRLLPLTKTTVKTDHSRCLHCGYTLRWYDLIPLVSWLTLGGKCRHCHHKIGTFEPIIELATMAYFIVSYLCWPQPLDTWQAITHFVLWLVAGVALAILFAYDAKWQLLPDSLNLLVGIIGGLMALLSVLTATDPAQQLLTVVLSVAVLGGLYLLLYIISRGRWVGFGDVKLGIGLGLLLGDWQLALLALFAANLIGSLAVLPGLAFGKLTSNSHIPFGPFLILGTIISQLFGMDLINYYLTHVVLML